ncbi:MAG: hypothetical protein V3U56_05095 [Syntrophobacteria bacterium]
MFGLNKRYAASWLEVAKGKSLDHLQLGRGRLVLGEMASGHPTTYPGS